MPDQPTFVAPKRAPIAILGVPFDNVTTTETLELIEAMIATRQPHYLATANVDFVVQALDDEELRRILFEAHLVLCDGMPLVWASRWLSNPLPERVAGSDLVPLLIALAARKGHRIYFLGGTPETTARAVKRVQASHPNLQVAGWDSPPFAPLLEMDHEGINARIRDAKPDMVFVSFGCPKQEKWIAMNHQLIGVPLCVGVGATIDFLAGSISRAPVWMQQSGLEWIFRLIQEPRRLYKRYAKDSWVFGRALLRQRWIMRQPSSKSPRGHTAPAKTSADGATQTLRFPARLDAAAVETDGTVWLDAARTGADLLCDLSDVSFIDSTGVGALIRLQKQSHTHGGRMVLAGECASVRRSLALMKLDTFFAWAPNLGAAQTLATTLQTTRSVASGTKPSEDVGQLSWQGDITAASQNSVWKQTEPMLLSHVHTEGTILIDLEEVKFMDSSGLGLMLRVRRAARQHSLHIEFLRAPANVRDLIRRSALEPYLLGGTR